MSKKKIVTSAVALGVAAAIGLGGTFAWQSINQTAINEGSDVVNPGGRLHNDLAYTDALMTDNNIYVENFTTEATGGRDIFARVRLEEYMEIVLNKGTAGEKVVSVLGSKTVKTDENGDPVDADLTADSATEKDKFDYERVIHLFDKGKENAAAEYIELIGGDSDSETVYYLPTFNKNKDSLAADLNGLYDERVGGISDRGEDQYFDGRAEYSENQSQKGLAIYDADSNTTDELGALSPEQLNQIIFGNEGGMNEGGENAGCWKENADTFAKAVRLVEETHETKAVGKSNGLISMSDWLALNGGTYSEETHGDYWVYDTDGWVYWSSPIAPGETTGLLLDGFTLTQVMNDTWYYSMEVVAQFVTADDVGKADGTGFYDTSAGAAPSVNAQVLLNDIGVDMDGVVEVSTVDELNEALQNAKVVVLTADISSNAEVTSTKNVTLNLNGHSITRGGQYEIGDGTSPYNSTCVIRVNGGTLDLTGSGSILCASNSTNVRGLYVHGGATVNLRGDIYYCVRNHDVFVYRDQGTVNVYDGFFRTSGKGSDEDLTLAGGFSNKTDKKLIWVYGGTYLGDESGVAYFGAGGRNVVNVAEGYEMVNSGTYNRDGTTYTKWTVVPKGSTGN